jgi:hypothetical protein
MSAELGERRRAIAAGAVCAAALASLVAPAATSAHAINQVYQLPLPLPLYLAGAGGAVAVSFLATVVVARAPSDVPRYATSRLPEGLASVASVALCAVGLAWWLLAIASGFVLDDASPLPAVLFWIGIWVGLPLVAILFGNPWPSLSPFRTIFAALEWAARRTGFDRLDAGLRYPAGLARWPALILLAIAVWCELVLLGSELAGTVARLMAVYTVLTLVGVALFGTVVWLRNAELFEVMFGWFGRIGPLGRRAARDELCRECSTGCDPSRCIDCPECAVVAERGDLRPELRPWFAGLTEVGPAGWSDAAFVVLLLTAVSFDGLAETSAWGAVLNVMFPPLLEVVGPLWAIPVTQTIGLAGLYAAFLLAFSAAASLTRRLGARTQTDAQAAPQAARPPFGETAAAYASTLLPIAAGYLVAHYLTLVVQGAVSLPGLLVNPYGAIGEIGWIPSAAVWYVSVGSIVLGHVAAVVLAHRIALRDAPGRPALAGLPLVILMIGYTILSLWIIAQPITIEPGLTPAGG